MKDLKSPTGFSFPSHVIQIVLKVEGPFPSSILPIPDLRDELHKEENSLFLCCGRPGVLRFWLIECTGGRSTAGDNADRLCGSGSFVKASAISSSAGRVRIQPAQGQSCLSAADQRARRSSDLIMSFRVSRKPKWMFSLFQMGFFLLSFFLLHISPFPPSHSILIGLKPLRLPLLWSSFILIATAHCRLCPYVIAAQQMDRNAPQNLLRYY